jgi:hypothetical protein
VRPATEKEGRGKMQSTRTLIGTVGAALATVAVACQPVLAAAPTPEASADGGVPSISTGCDQDPAQLGGALRLCVGGDYDPAQLEDVLGFCAGWPGDYEGAFAEMGPDFTIETQTTASQ